jgi:L-ascorbate metabolism protein UlaG (beta-lactamase superfamily)
MRISKYVHSCLVLEENGDKLLFDPGRFSFLEGRVRPEEFHDVSTIVVTHGHPDHLDIEALRRIVQLSGATVVTNGATAQQLGDAGLPATVLEDGSATAGSFTLRAFTAPHEQILSDTLPQNTAYLVNESVLNPGDSFSPAFASLTGMPTLVLPVMAPWLTELAALRFAASLRPQLVIPVHDGYARDFFLPQRYDVYEPYLARVGIRFARLLEPGASVAAP